MTKVRLILAGAALAVVASAAQADVSFTPTVVSDYDFRGYSQSAKDPALQLSVDVTNGPVHVGAWGSNINFGQGGYGGSSAELDFAADYTFGSDSSWLKVNTGVVYYTYTGSATSGSYVYGNYPEAWVSASHGWFSVAAHYSNDWAGTSTDALYLEGNVTVPLGESGFGITGHYGYSDGQYWGDSKYSDYSIGATYAFAGFNFAVKYVDSNGDAVPVSYGYNKDVLSNDGRVIASVSTTLPWAK